MTIRPEAVESPEHEVLRWRPRVVHDSAPVDLAAAERAAADLLAALGLPVESEHMVETPRRMAQAYAELLTVGEFAMTTFPNAEGYDELVLVEDVPLRSLCEHHMLPFVGVAHVGYLPADRIVGLSKVARMVDFYSHRAQTQERLTKQIAEHLQQQLAPRGVGVVVARRAQLHEPARRTRGGGQDGHLGAVRRPA
jgi:GTP cyclohydrolase IA